MNTKKRFDPDSISDAQLIDEIKKLANLLGRTPSRNDMIKYGTDITKRLYLYSRRFGGLREAQKLAGLKENIGGSDCAYSKEELLGEIVKLSKKLKRTPTQDEISKLGKYPIGAYKRHFGTYNKALGQINIERNVKFGITRQEIINDIIRVSKLLDKTPTIDEFDEHTNTASSVTAYKKLNCKNSWNKVLKVCGLPITYNKNLTEQDFKDEVIRLETKLGHIPTYNDMVQFGNYSPESYAFNFGSYVKALHYFGFDYIPENQFEQQCYTKGKDRKLYRSKFEACLADILYDKGVNYEYEKRICLERQWTCDFYLPNFNIWLEADGMEHNRKISYEDDRNEKIKYYKEKKFNYYIIKYSSNYLQGIENILNTNSPIQK